MPGCDLDPKRPRAPWFRYDLEWSCVMQDSLDEIIEGSAILPTLKVILDVDCIKGDMGTMCTFWSNMRDDNIVEVRHIHDAINGFYHSA